MSLDNINIIGVSGRKQSGKTTLCGFLEFFYTVNSSESTESINTYSFADALKKDICVGVLGLTEDQVNGTDEQKNSLTEYRWDNLPLDIRLAYSNEKQDVLMGAEASSPSAEPELYYEKYTKPRFGQMTAREVMQVVGTDIFRKMFSDNIWVNSVFNRIQQDKPKIALIADVRFTSEVNAIIDRGGSIIRLERKAYPDSHVSEIDLDNYDFASLGGDRCLIIDNNDMAIEDKNKMAMDWFSHYLI